MVLEPARAGKPILQHAHLVAGAGAVRRRCAEVAVFRCDETPGWKPRQLAVYAGILEERVQLAAELGEEAAEVLVAEASMTPALLEKTRRILVVATR